GSLDQNSKGEIRRCNIATNEFELLGKVNFTYEIDINNMFELSYDKSLKTIKLRSKNSYKFTDVCMFDYTKYVDESWLNLGFVTTNSNWTINHESVRFQVITSNYIEEIKRIREILNTKPYEGKRYCSIGDSLSWLDG